MADVFPGTPVTQPGSIQNSDEIRKRIKKYSQCHNLKSNFEKIFKIICGEETNFSEDFKIEYHIVVFNTNINVRFTIMESKQLISARKDEDSKPNDYGVVGKLYSGDEVSTDFIMVQFGYGVVAPYVYMNDNDLIGGNERQNIRALTEDELREFIGDGSYSWANTGKTASTDSDSESGDKKQQQQERTYAIATMLFAINEKEKGAITFDFITKTKKYPNFAFRKKEIETIYKSMKKLKGIIEMLLQNNLYKELSEITNIALGGEMKNGNQ